MSAEYGGNPRYSTGQMVITGTAQPIPFPTNLTQVNLIAGIFNVSPTMPGQSFIASGDEGRLRKIRATDDVWIGAAGVTPTTGWKVPAGTVEVLTTRDVIYVVGMPESGESSSSSLSPVPTSSSSSLSSSLVPVPTYGTLNWSEEWA